MPKYKTNFISHARVINEDEAKTFLSIASIAELKKLIPNELHKITDGVNQRKGSKYQGVRINRTYKIKIWTATVCLNNKIMMRKAFLTELEAAHAYNAKILELGLDRPLNIIDESPVN